MNDTIFRVPSGTIMTPSLLAEYIGKHKQIVNNRYEKLQNAYENKYEIYDQPKKPDWKPDNRISVNFAKYIVDTFNGFFCGIPIKTTSENETVAAYLEFLDQYNDQDNGNAEISKISDIHGVGHEMYYVDPDGEIGITYLSPMESFFIFDDSILERKLFFVRYYKDADNIERGSWSDSRVVQHFENAGTYKWTGEPKKHGFDGVPASEYIENDERMGLFESALPAINAYNKAISEKANDVDYFADAYMKILGPKINDDDIPYIRRNRIINFEGGDDGSPMPTVAFLEKPNADTTQENLINRLERLIFQMSMVANISDENFGTSSGIALRYKLQSMNNLFRQKERKFTSGMNRRYKLIFSNPISQSHGVKKDDWLNIKYQFTPNYPANLAEESDIASKLEGVVSEETKLKVLSIVDNVSEEIGRMEKEQNKIGNDAVMNRMFSSGGNSQSVAQTDLRV